MNVSRSVKYPTNVRGSVEYRTLVEQTLNRFPEVTWDRWSGGNPNMAVFGWIPREDGKADFVLLHFNNEGPTFISTSSAKYSAEFCARLADFGFGDDHHPCERVEDYFPNVKATHLRNSQ